MTIKVDKIVAFLFYIAYTLMVVNDMFVNVKNFEAYSNYIDYLSVFILMIVFIMQRKKYTMRSLLLTLLIIAISIVSSYISKDKTILKLVLLIINFRDLNFDNFIKKDFFIKLLLILSVIVLYFLGKTETVYVYRNGIVRNSFGFSHPNICAMYLLMLCLDIIYIFRNKKNIAIIFSAAIMFLVYKIVDSRSTLLILGIVIFLLLIEKIILIFNKRKVVLNFLLKNMFLILTIISIIISFTYDVSNRDWYTINKLFSGRFALNAYYMDNYEINLLGNEVLTDKYYMLDNAYLNILLRYGIITFILCDFLFRKSFEKMLKEDNYILAIIFIVLLLYGFSETFLYKVTRNAFLLYFANIIYKDNEFLLKK